MSLHVNNSSNLIGLSNKSAVMIAVGGTYANKVALNTVYDDQDKPLCSAAELCKVK